MLGMHLQILSIVVAILLTPPAAAVHIYLLNWTAIDNNNLGETGTADNIQSVLSYLPVFAQISLPVANFQ